MSDERLRELRKSVQQNPTDWSLRFELGRALFTEGLLDEAIMELQQSKQDPRMKSLAGYYLGRCFVIKKLYKLAVSELGKAQAERHEMDTLKKDITYLLGRIYEQANKRDKAIAEYERIAAGGWGDGPTGVRARLRPTDPPRVPPHPLQGGEQSEAVP